MIRSSMNKWSNDVGTYDDGHDAGPVDGFIDVIVSLFDGKKADVTSAKFDFDTAAEVGKALKNVDACEIRYSCPFKGEQIVKLIS